MENDPKNRPGEPLSPPSYIYRREAPKKPGNGMWTTLAAVGAVAIAAYLTIGRADIGRLQDKPYANMTEGQMSRPFYDVEPAAGDPPNPETPPVVTTSPVEPGAAMAPNTYASEDECKSATNTPCHFMTCDAVPEGKQPDEACGPDFKKGWQPVVPAVDTTNVPEKVEPPLMGRDDVDQMTKPPGADAPHQ